MSEMSSNFYILENKGWYALYIRSTHFCISAGVDLDVRLEVLDSYIKKYKTMIGINHLIKGLEFTSIISKASFDYLEGVYNDTTYHYEDIINEVVNKALEEVKNNSPFNKAKRLLSKRTSCLITTPPPVHKGLKKTSEPPKVISPKKCLAKRPLLKVN